VVLDPKFADNHWIYWSYSEPAPGGISSTAVARGKLDSNALRGQLSDVQVIFRQAPKLASTVHFGSRLVFARDGRLFVTLGDLSGRDDAQLLSNHHGKIVRIEPDGRVPADNPFVARSGALPEIWSYGHRNVQGAALHPQTGELWAHEHGPQGGDELNVVEAGHNYGWPVITFGAEYGSGLPIGEGTAKPGMEQPLVYWVPSIAPSGMAFLTSERYPGWKGSLFIGALRGEMLLRLQLDGRRVVRQERLLQDLRERIRDVRQGPDGWLYLLTDSDDGKLLRVEPR
jgi:aldose sugar dehydrogenase